MNARIPAPVSAIHWSKRGGLSTACPVLLAVLFLLNLTLPAGLGIWALYSVAIVAAIPTWDHRLVRELAAAAAVLVVLHTVLQHDPATQTMTLLSNGIVGLLVVWVVLRLSQEVIQVHQHQTGRQPRLPENQPAPTQNPEHILTMCAWTKRVKDGDHWIPIEEYLARHMNVVVTHGISEESRDRILRALRLL